MKRLCGLLVKSKCDENGFHPMTRTCWLVGQAEWTGHLMVSVTVYWLHFSVLVLNIGSCWGFCLAGEILIVYRWFVWSDQTANHPRDGGLLHGWSSASLVCIFLSSRHTVQITNGSEVEVRLTAECPACVSTPLDRQSELACLFVSVRLSMAFNVVVNPALRLIHWSINRPMNRLATGRPPTTYWAV